MHSSKKAVEEFLAQLRMAIEIGFTFVPRRKNLSTLARLGISVEDAKNEIKALSYREYVKGPEADRDKAKEEPFWIFKKVVCGELLYIKVKILYQSDGSAKAVSFHLDETEEEAKP